MARISALAAGTSLISVLACGSEVPPGDEEMMPLAVAAVPPGSSFEGTTTVALEASRPAQIFYTVSGQDPLGPEGRLYQQPLELQEATLMTFMAISTDGVWSPPVTELYSPTTPLVPPDPVPRSLSINPSSYFFSPPQGEDQPQTSTFVLRSDGFETVHIDKIYIGSSSAFFESGVFSVDAPALENFDLAPGERLPIDVSYLPTQTLRGAALVIVSNEMKHSGGFIVVELWGRIISW